MAAKKTISDVTKELGVDRKDLVDALEKLGRKVTAKTTLTDEDLERLRDTMGLNPKPQVRIGEERQLADGVEKRVAGNVIRRRKAVKETAPTAAAEAMSEQHDGEMTPPPPAEMLSELSEDLPPLAPEASSARPLAAEPEPSPVVADAEEEPVELGEVEAPAPSRPDGAQPPAAATPGEVRPAEPAARGGARVLGRIDLRKVEAPKPSGFRPAPAPAPAGAPDTRLRRGDGAAKPATPAEEESKEKKGGRRKLKVITKDAFELDRGGRGGRLPRKKRALPGKEQKKTEVTVPKASKRVIRISEFITAGELAKQMGIKAGEVLKKLMDLGMMATINQPLDFDTATLVAQDFQFVVENVAFNAESAIATDHEAVAEEEEASEGRPPVVTIMGHVDHGKTSLLDAIRKTKVADGEAGGITQHIGAYSVTADGRRITFVDTPGHEAFTAMRARGARVTDIVILVVAADDGVMPQTVEAISHARAANVPIVVAVNKIDRPDANLERVKRGLADHGLAAEDWGGDTAIVPVSAKTGEGLPALLEMVLLQADVLELRSNPNKLAKGVVIEAKLERGRGPVATVLVQEGTLKTGDPFVCGSQYGRVRAMVDETGKRIDEAGPATPVELLGFQGVPEAGDSFTAVSDEATARQVASHRLDKKRQSQLTATSKTSLDDLFGKIKTGETKELKIILKADVQGSVEAVQEALSRLSTDEVKLTVLHASVGGVSEGDVLLASASDALIIGFNIRPESKAADLAEREGVEIRLYTIIYEALNDVRAALEGMLAPTLREKILGRAEVRQPFSISGLGTIAGCSVTEGKFQRSSRVRLVRDNVQVFEGKIASLRRFKDDVREVTAGLECGIGLENFNDVKPGDVIEAFEVEEIARRLGPPTAKGSAAAVERTA